MTQYNDLPELTFRRTGDEPPMVVYTEAQLIDKPVGKFAATAIIHILILLAALVIWVPLSYEINGRYYPIYSTHTGPIDLMEAIITIAIPSLLIALIISGAIEYCLLIEWRGISGNIDGTRYSWRATSRSVSMMSDNQKLMLGCYFIDVKQKSKFVKLENIKGFVLTTHQEWSGAPSPKMPPVFMILVDLGPGGTIPICAHIRDKPQVAALQALLTDVFLTNRPVIAVPPNDDDPI